MQISNPKDIHINDYDYDLADDRIAKYPLKERDASKLLVSRGEEIDDVRFGMLPDYLPKDSLLIFNNTKVIQARLFFQKATGAQIEIFCLEPHTPNDYLLSFQQNERCSWVCLVGNLKKWKEGSLTKKIAIADGEVELRATRLEATHDSHIVSFEWDNPNYSFSDLLELTGELPIPPYLNRRTEEEDKETYQTVYSKIEGSVAAPTAGLHFTEKVFAQLKNKGILTDEVTLHVGAGTFKPVKSDLIKDHEMHSEFISVKKSMIEHLLAHQGKVIAVGTTSVRTLESLYYIGESLERPLEDGISLKVGQWQPYDEAWNRITRQKALGNILSYLNANKLDTLVADTQIMITPGYEFKIVDGIITNFHQPKSTLLLLISAFVANNDWKRLYNHALENNYRFLSYGDSSLLLKN